MAYVAKTYTLREESIESGTRYSISFKDGQGKHHELEVSEQLFFEFRQMERRNRNLQQWNQHIVYHFFTKITQVKLHYSHSQT